MKILTETAEQLHIRNFNLYIGIFGWSCALLVLGKLIQLAYSGQFQPADWYHIFAFFIFFFGGSAFAKKEDVIFNKEEKMVYWSRKVLFGTKQGSIPFNHIVDIVVERTHGDSNFRHRVSIKTDSRVITITEAYSAGSVHQYDQVVDKIKAIIS
ncbi:hypothetical protein JW960_14460 [candidate division KSB1 bacterium]|nr:hypothetical protein [candidate division KSB1 bacterium]